MNLQSGAGFDKYYYKGVRILTQSYMKNKNCDTEEEGCGVPWLFHTTCDDPFYKCCLIHDKEYDSVPPGTSTKQIDEEFLECCLKVAGTDWPLKRRAKLYYRLCRIYGSARYALGKLGIWRIWE